MGAVLVIALNVVKAASTTIRASRPTPAIAGRIYTRVWQKSAVLDKAKNGTRWIQNGQRGYRGAANKDKYGRSSSITNSLKGRHDYRILHVEHRTKWF